MKCWKNIGKQTDRQLTSHIFLQEINRFRLILLTILSSLLGRKLKLKWCNDEYLFLISNIPIYIYTNLLSKVTKLAYNMERFSYTNKVLLSFAITSNKVSNNIVIVITPRNKMILKIWPCFCLLLTKIYVFCYIQSHFRYIKINCINKRWF